MKASLAQLGLVLLSAGLLVASFPPFDLEFLAWIALAPLALALEGIERPRGTWSIYLHGVAFFAPGLWWMTEVAGAGLAVTVFHLGFFQMAVLGPMVLVRRRWRLPWVALLPIAWTATEYVRSFLLTGFPWLFVSHTQWRFLSLIQIADTLGAYGVTFVVASASGALADLAIRRRMDRVALATAAAPALLVAASWAYGSWRLDEASFEQGPRIAVVQGSIPQDMKVEAVRLSSQGVMDRHLRLSLATLDEDPDLIVWAETMVPGRWNVDVRFRRQAEDLARRHGVRLLLGSNSLDQLDDGRYAMANSAFYLDEEGRLVARYDKAHLVPVGEYNPYDGFLPRTNQIIYTTAGFLPELSPGSGPVPMQLDGHRFSTIICFEQIFPAQTREWTADDIDFLVLITNDAWWGDSFEYEQFLAIAVFRAIENRTGMVRCGNTGISAFIDPSGLVVDALERDGRRKNVTGFLVRSVAIDDRHSPYQTVGDLFARLCLAAVALAAIACLRRPRPADRES